MKTAQHHQPSLEGRTYAARQHRSSDGTTVLLCPRHLVQSVAFCDTLSYPYKTKAVIIAITFMGTTMAGENYVLERIARILVSHGVTADTAGLALCIMRTIHAGDDIGNGLRAIPIEALDELREFLNRNAQSLAQAEANTYERTQSAA